MSKIKEGDRVKVYGFFGEDARKATVTYTAGGAASVTWDEPVKTPNYISHTDVVSVAKCRKLVKKKIKVVLEDFWFSTYNGDLVFFMEEAAKVAHLEGKTVRATFEVIEND